MQELEMWVDTRMAIVRINQKELLVCDKKGKYYMICRDSVRQVADCQHEEVKTVLHSHQCT